MLGALLGAASVALAACSGTAVVTMTSTASTDNFLAYRVSLVAVQLQGSSGNAGLTVLPASTMVDFATLTEVSEVLGAATVGKGTYTSALITLDYSAAQIVYDDGSVNGVTLTPVGADGRALAQVQIKLSLDPGDPFRVAPKGASQLALDFNLAASNLVDASRKTVTVTPLIAGSALPIDAKPVRVRGPLAGIGGVANPANASDTTASGATSSGSFTLNVMPFNSTAAGGGQLAVILTDLTTYEINGVESTGVTGQGQLSTSGSGALAIAYGTLENVDPVATTTTSGQTSATPSTVSFVASQVLTGGSVQGALDRVSGTVAARSGDTLALEDATVVGADGLETFIGGTTTVLMGPNTLVTVFGQGGTQLNDAQQVSVGSVIDAFGVASVESSDTATVDVSAGLVRLDNTTASGLVTAQGTGVLNLHLAFLGGRAIAPFDFIGSGAAAAQYQVSTDQVSTGALDLTNSTPGAPVIVTGLTAAFGAAPPNFIAATLLDPTTIPAQLVVDYGAGTAAPFTTYNSSAIDVDIRNPSIGVRHEIQVGAQTINVPGLASDVSIVPDPTASNTVFTIGHAASSSTESFETYAAFVARVQAELQGATLATGVTATGQYTASTTTLSATSITLYLNH
jgi:hypothetical protein